MTDAEKEMYIEGLKRQVRSQHTPEVAEELCRRLDEAKKGADSLEQLFNKIQTAL